MTENAIASIECAEKKIHAVQFHPERGTIYDELFDDFITRVRDAGKGEIE